MTAHVGMKDVGVSGTVVQLYRLCRLMELSHLMFEEAKRPKSVRGKCLPGDSKKAKRPKYQSTTSYKSWLSEKVL